MEVGIQRVEKNQAVRGKKFGEEPGEGTTVGVLWGITRAQDFEQFKAARTRQAVFDFLQQPFDLEAERNAPSGSRFLSRRRQDKLVQLAFIEPCRVADFVNVVIFRGHPEDRNGFDPGEREFARRLDGGERLIEGIGRAAEESHLLSAHNGDRAVFEAPQIVFGFRAAAEREIVRAKNPRHFPAAIRRKIQLPGVCLGGMQFRFVLVEVLQAGKILSVIVNELAGMRQAGG